VCLCVGFDIFEYVYVWVLKSVNMCMFGFFNMWLCVYVVFVMCVYVLVVICADVCMCGFCNV
jgi:hypothetical protein